MRWRDVIIGAVVTLAITIFGGVLVYYLTRDKPLPPATERLVFELEKPTVFETEAVKRSFLTVRAGNIGNKTATDVRLAVLFEKPMKVVDKKISLSSEPAGTFEDRTEKPHRVDLIVPALVPGETVTVTMMIDGVVKSPPTVGLRSSDSSGEAGKFVREVPEEPGKKKTLGNVLSTLIPLAALLQLVLLPLLSARFRNRILRHFPTARSVNDTAFLYIHKGLVKEGQELLSNEVKSRGADAITLANYGLALGLCGDQDGAEKRLDAAEWWARHKHEQAIVAFNRAVLAFSRKDFSQGMEHLAKAFTLSKTEREVL